jgi:hypothetical protein
MQKTDFIFIASIYKQRKREKTFDKTLCPNYNLSDKRL